MCVCLFVKLQINMWWTVKINQQGQLVENRKVNGIFESLPSLVQKKKKKLKEQDRYRVQKSVLHSDKDF